MDVKYSSVKESSQTDLRRRTEELHVRWRWQSEN
jgi:hypothetical protein